MHLHMHFHGSDTAVDAAGPGGACSDLTESTLAGASISLVAAAFIVLLIVLVSRILRISPGSVV